MRVLFCRLSDLVMCTVQMQKVLETLHSHRQTDWRTDILIGAMQGCERARKMLI